MAALLGSNAAALVEARESEKRFSLANDFFNTTAPAPKLGAAPPAAPAPAGPAPAAGTDPSVATNDGAVQFHLIGQKPDDPKYSGIMQENADNLLAMGGLIYTYMKNSYPNVNAQAIDIDTWTGVVQNLPDLTIGQSVKKQYQNRVAGVSVSADFLSMIAKAIITDGASILTDFTSFLNSVGNVTFSASNNQESYRILTCSYLNYLVADGLGGYYDYSAIALRQVDFLEHFQELRSSCASASYVNINMSYSEVMTIVNTRRIRKGGPDYDNFQGLVNANSTAQFSKAKNFFNPPAAKQSDVQPQT